MNSENGIISENSFYRESGRIGDHAQGTQCLRSAEVLLSVHVACQTGGDHIDILGDLRQLLDAQVEQASERRIFRLEQTCHVEERIGGLLGGQNFALVQQVQNFGER